MCIYFSDFRIIWLPTFSPKLCKRKPKRVVWLLLILNANISTFWKHFEPQTTNISINKTAMNEHFTHFSRTVRSNVRQMCSNWSKLWKCEKKILRKLSMTFEFSRWIFRNGIKTWIQTDKNVNSHLLVFGPVFRNSPAQPFCIRLIQSVVVLCP